MRKLLCLFFLTIFNLHAGEEVRLAAESEPLLTVADCVSVLDGSFFQVNQDFVVEGPKPLTYTRHYDSGDQNPDFLKYNHYGYGVSLGYPLNLKFCSNIEFNKKYDSLHIDQRHRFSIPFVLKKTNGAITKAIFNKDMFKYGYTNCTTALERGQPSLAHTEAIVRRGLASSRDNVWEVCDTDGTKRIYTYYKWEGQWQVYSKDLYLLLREDHPNGLSTHYLYDQGCLVKVSLRNSVDQEELTSISIAYNNQEASYIITGSDGRSIKYQQTQMKTDEGTTPFLSSVSGDNQPKIDYEYCLKKGKKTLPLLKKMSASNGGCLEIEYRDYDVVKNLWGSLSKKNAHERKFSFEYKGNRTIVQDALGRKNVYHFDDKRRLKAREEAGIKETRYVWNSHGQLSSKSIAKGKLFSEQIVFHYDEKGNIKQKIECGNITGDSPELFSFARPISAQDPASRSYHYHYGDKNLLLYKIDPNGLKTLYAYKPGTNLLTCKRLSLNGALFSRELYTYDKNGILIQTIEDDGYEDLNADDLTNVTYRLITRLQPQMDKSLWGFTKPKVEEQLYLDFATREEKLLKRTEMEYVRGGMLGKKRVYDSEGAFAYEESYQYNNQLLLEEKCDCLGRVTRYRYDDCNNVIYEELVGSGKQTYKTYDCNNRLIEAREIHDDGTVLIAGCAYDLVGNCTSVTDGEGFTTQFFYDGLNRKVKEIDPQGHEIYMTYDDRDNPIAITDKEGHTTYTKFNIDHHPIKIEYPDGTLEEFRYYVDGTLKSKKEKDGTSITYTYDYLRRVLTENRLDQSGTLLTTKTFIYKGANLMTETDPQGIVTNYSYDSAKRLIAKTRESVTESYGYDTLGRQCITTKGGKATQKIFDPSNQVIEERIEDLIGNVYRKTVFTYDVYGNVCQKHTYTGESAIQTSTVYNSYNLPIMQIDGMGNEITITYNHCPFQKIIKDPLGKTTIETYDAFKRVISTEISGLSKQEVVYSPNGHRIKQIDHIYQQGVETGLSTVAWKYDPMGNVVSIIEQDLKETFHAYLYGRLDTTQKPDGVLLHHTYDPLGKLLEQSSSDGNLWTLYSYDLNGNMLSAIDKVNDHSVARTYDAHHNILSETTHTTLHYAYDELDRLIEIRFPDSVINYTYNPVDLVSISRSGKTHTYLYDLAGRLLQENTFDGTTTFYSYDDNNHIVSIISPFYVQSFIYNEVGNIASTTLNGQTTNYTYDGLYQLVAENSTSYTYDSLYNRLSKDNSHYQHNVMHHVLSDDENIYTCDLNGNRLTKNGIVYTYDPLNKLTSAGEITYSYDSLGRLQTRTSPTSQESFLYYQEIELGSIDSLKIVGKGIAGLEQKGRLYSVVRDHRGSPCVMLYNASSVGIYTYTAFGEASHIGMVHSPWQYAGYRCDAETQLLHAAKRIYDPYIGRWLTPDPLGFADGPNLYAYVHNNPLIFIDPTGLYSMILDGNNNMFYPFVQNEPSTSFNDDWEKGRNTSSRYNLGSEGYQDLGKGRMGFIPGIDTSFEEFKGHLRHLGNLSGGFNFYGVHNATNGPFRDACEYGLNRHYVATPPVGLLHEEWSDYFASADKHTPFFAVCHSQGAVLVRNALMSYPPDLRKRIIVVAIAPGCYIDRSLCKEVTHYVTNGDLVGWMDPSGRYSCRKDIVVLESKTRTGFMDHDFQSRTYENAIINETQNYITNYGF